MTVLDIGAHQGEDTEYYLARGHKVVAFECATRNIQILEDKFKHEIDEGNLILEKRALLKGGGEGKTATFYADELSVWGTLNQEWSSRNEVLGSRNCQITVDTIDPSDIYRLYGVPLYMKIDVEGCDVLVLESLKQVPAGNRPRYVSIESSKTSWSALVEEFALFEALGYSRFAVVAQSNNSKKISRWNYSGGKAESFRHKKHSSGPFGQDLPEKWMSKKRAILIYKFIFFRYKFFGDYGILAPSKIKIGILRSAYKLILYISFLSPNWFDTHAMRE